MHSLQNERKVYKVEAKNWGKIMDLKLVMIKGKGDTHYPVPGKVKGEQTNQGKGCESTALDIYAHLAHGSSSSMACQSNILCSYDEAIRKMTRDLA